MLIRYRLKSCKNALKMETLHVDDPTDATKSGATRLIHQDQIKSFSSSDLPSPLPFEERPADTDLNNMYRLIIDVSSVLY